MQLCEAWKKIARLENLIKTALPDDRLSRIFSLLAAPAKEATAAAATVDFAANFALFHLGDGIRGALSAKEMRNGTAVSLFLLVGLGWVHAGQGDTNAIPLFTLRDEAKDFEAKPLLFVPAEKY